MSLFDTDIIERTMYVRHAYNIDIDWFSPNLFYKWIWKEKGVDYPPRYPMLEGVPKQLLYNILVDKLGDIPADDFFKWREEIIKKNSKKHFRRYFKKLIKREYMSSFGNFCVYLMKEDVRVDLPYEGVFGESIKMTIYFRRK